MTTADTHMEEAHRLVGQAARQLALALQHDPDVVNRLAAWEREVLLRQGLKRCLLEAERMATRTPLDTRLTKRPRSKVDPIYKDQRSRLKLKK